MENKNTFIRVVIDPETNEPLEIWLSRPFREMLVQLNREEFDILDNLISDSIFDYWLRNSREGIKTVKEAYELKTGKEYEGDIF